MQSTPVTAPTSRAASAINFAQKLGLFSDHWQPRVIAE